MPIALLELKKFIWVFTFQKVKKNVAKNRERTPLKEIFQLAEATEEWVKPEYMNAV